jgi:hypothetical protein
MPTRKKAVAKEATPISVGVMEVTPEMAGQWLEDNHVNRKIRASLVSAYRRDMEAGRWEMTAEPIQISRTGALLNGQHRLTALAGADPKKVDHVEMVVAQGLDDHVQTMMDQGKARSVVDALHIEHGQIKNVTLVGAVSRWLVLCPEPGPHMNSNSLRGRVTVAESLATYNKYQREIDIACAEATSLRPYLPGSPSAVAYTYFAFLRVDAQACTEFFAGMKDMEWSWKDDPRKAAWRRMNYIHRDQEIRASLETAVMLVSVMTRAWNAWRKQEGMETIQVRTRTGLIPPVKPV